MTLFPEMVLPAVGHSILRRASEARAVSFGAVNPRDFAMDAHRTVDDNPFGGGAGMVLKPDVMAAAIRSVYQPGVSRVVLTEPWGRRFEQADAASLASSSHVVFLCGHYEGIDGRVGPMFAAEVFSLGDFVLTGGELPSLVMADAVVRLLPGVLGSAASLESDSHAGGLLTGPQFTRPWDFEGVTPPDVLRSGDHQAIAKHQRQRALRLTRERRPDLFASAPLEKSDLDLLS